MNTASRGGIGEAAHSIFKLAMSLVPLRQFRLDLQRGWDAQPSEMLKYNINPAAISPTHKCWDECDDAGQPVLHRLAEGTVALCTRCGRTHQCTGLAATPEPAVGDPCTIFQEEGHYVCLHTGRIIEDMGAVYYSAGSFAEYEEQHTASGITEEEQPATSGSSVHDATLEYRAAQFTSDHAHRNRKFTALVQSRSHRDIARDARRIERINADAEAFTDAAQLWPARAELAVHEDGAEKALPPVRRLRIQMGYAPSSTTAFGSTATVTGDGAAANTAQRDVNYWADVVFGRDAATLMPRLFDRPPKDLASLRQLFRPATPLRVTARAPRLRHYKVGHARSSETLRHEARSGEAHHRRHETEEVDVEWMWAMKAQLERFFEWALREMPRAGLPTLPCEPPIARYLDILGRWARLVMLTRNRDTSTLEVLPPMRTMVAFFLEFAPKDIAVYNGQGHCLPLFQADAWARCLAQNYVVQQAVFHLDIKKTGEAAVAQGETLTTAQLIDRIWQAAGPTAASALPPSARRVLFAGALDEHATVAQIKKTISDMQEQLKRAHTAGMALWEWFHGAATQTWPLARGSSLRSLE